MKALVTGHTGNLGLACVKTLKAAGWQVSGFSRQETINLPVKEDGVDFANGPAFDLVIMAHGVQRPALLADLTEADWGLIVDNNLRSAVDLTSSLLKHDRVENGGLIVYCSSIQATQPRAGRGLYAIAKAGLEALTRVVAVEGAVKNIRSVALRLGQMQGTMKGIVFSESQMKTIEAFTPLPWVDFTSTAELILTLHQQPSLSGEVIEISSGHKFSVWPKD